MSSLVSWVSSKQMKPRLLACVHASLRADCRFETCLDMLLQSLACLSASLCALTVKSCISRTRNHQPILIHSLIYCLIDSLSGCCIVSAVPARAVFKHSIFMLGNKRSLLWCSTPDCGSHLFQLLWSQTPLTTSRICLPTCETALELTHNHNVTCFKQCNAEGALW